VFRLIEGRKCEFSTNFRSRRNNKGSDVFGRQSSLLACAGRKEFKTRTRIS
jgi:hypothetical protein